MLYIKKKGSVDYTIVGTPTIVDGVASGFSNSPKSYLKTNSSFPNWSGISELDANIKARVTTKNKHGYAYHMGNFSLVTGGGASIFMVYIPGQSRYDIAYTLNTYYDIRVHLKDNVWSIYLNGVLKKTYDVTSSITDSTTPVGFGNTYNGVNSLGFQGSIDLNNTYIKINGQPWFGVCPVEVKKHQIMGPVGYELSGNATVTDGILTGVDSSSSCGTSISLPSDFNELEFVFKARRSSWTAGSTSQILPLCGWGTGSGSTRRITTNSASGEGQGTRVFNGSSQIVNIDNSRFDVTAYTNSGYYTRLRVIKNANDYTYELGLSGNKQVWVTASANYPTNICANNKLWLLRNSSGSTSSTGEMDLNETYAKVDGKIWFWQPRETERIVVNGVEVWNKNEV
jgi:hypothetical protein